MPTVSTLTLFYFIIHAGNGFFAKVIGSKPVTTGNINCVFFMLNHTGGERGWSETQICNFFFLFTVNMAIPLYNFNIPDSSTTLDIQQPQNILERKYYCPRRNESPEKQIDVHAPQRIKYIPGGRRIISRTNAWYTLKHLKTVFALQYNSGCPGEKSRPPPLGTWLQQSGHFITEGTTVSVHLSAASVTSFFQWFPSILGFHLATWVYRH